MTAAGTKVGIQRLKNHRVLLSISLPTSPDGTAGRKCPSCRRFFKVDREVFGHPEITCPYCGATNSSNQFLTLDQRRRLRAAASRFGLAEMHRLLSNALGSLPRSSSRGLIEISIRPGRLELPPLLTYLEQETIRTSVCTRCARNASVYGIAMFCPNCGKRESIAVFEQAVRSAVAVLDATKSLPLEKRRVLEAEGGLDQLAENVLEDVVTAFEGCCRTRYEEVAGPGALASIQSSHGRNVFQRFEEAVTIMEGALGRPLGAGLSPAESAELKVAFATRHVLTHNMGIADARYAASGGVTPTGQRVQVTETMARRSMELVGRIIRAMY